MKKLISIALMLVSFSTYSDTYDKIYEALAFAEKYTEYSITHPLPAVIYTNAYWCPKPTQVCGRYNPITNEIVIENKKIMGEREQYGEVGLLIHEMVHYLQFTNGKKVENCANERLIEWEAYAVQAFYLRQFDVYISPRRIVSTIRCKENYGHINP